MNPTQGHDRAHADVTPDRPTMLVIEEEGGGVTTYVSYIFRDARPVILSIEITGGGSEITPPLLRAIAEGVHPTTERAVARLYATELGIPARTVAKEYETRRRRRKWTDTELRRVAEAYLAAPPRGRRKAVMQEMECSSATAARAIARAKTKGHIPETDEGDN